MKLLVFIQIMKVLLDALPRVCSTGVITEDVAMFGNSWTEEEPHQASCPMVPSLYPSPCAPQDAHTLLVLCHTACAVLCVFVYWSYFVMPIYWNWLWLLKIFAGVCSCWQILYWHCWHLWIDSMVYLMEEKKICYLCFFFLFRKLKKFVQHFLRALSSHVMNLSALILLWPAAQMTSACE